MTDPVTRQRQAHEQARADQIIAVMQCEGILRMEPNVFHGMIKSYLGRAKMFECPIGALQEIRDKYYALLAKADA